LTQEREKILGKAKKLKALADRGIDGEKDTAKRMYDTYKLKFKITDAEVKSFNKETEYDNMNYAEFFDALQVDLDMAISGMFGVIFGMVFKSDSLKRESTNLIFRSIKAKDKKNGTNNKS
jgi:hypothetical protein